MALVVWCSVSLGLSIPLDTQFFGTYLHQVIADQIQDPNFDDSQMKVLRYLHLGISFENGIKRVRLQEMMGEP